MISIAFRVIMAVIVASLLTFLGVRGNAVVLQTLFTVLGIVFSISMSQLVSLSLSKVLNREARVALRSAITRMRNILLLDFCLSTVAFAAALTWGDGSLITTHDYAIIDIMLTAVILVAVSLLYEVYSFQKLHKLHMDIEDAVIAEEVAKPKAR